MRIFFSDSFKKELKIFGNSIKLSTFRLGKYTKQIETWVDENEILNETVLPPTYDRLINHSELSDYFQYKSLWDRENFVLNTTLDFTVLPSKEYADEWITDNTVIFYYYSDINDNILDIAFILTGEIEADNQISPLDLCTFEIIDGKVRKDLNHVNFYFPKNVKSNILSLDLDENIEFLERSSNTPGINIFLVIEGEGSENDFLTKGSFLKYARDKKSLNNYSPVYLDGNGEKVFSSVNYRHYKSISITALNQLGTTSDGGTINYYIESDATITITGTLVYDLYKVNNGSYTLVKENEVEDLTNTVIKQTNGNGDLLTEGEITKNYIIDQLNKQIKFNISDIPTTSFKCSLVFNSELGDTRGTTVEILSNQLSFSTYAKWSVDYSTRFYQKNEKTGLTHALLLFDKTSMNSGWDPENKELPKSSETGKIVIYTDTEVNTNDIIIEQDSHSESFDSYFSIKKKALGYNTNNQKYKYEISITTKLDNNGDKWAPLDSSGESKLILNTIYINNLKNDSFEDVSFYCVQRVVSPLSLRTFDVATNSYGEDIIENVSFPGEFGVKSSNSLYLVGGITTDRGNNYTSWEYVENIDNITEGKIKENDVILEHLNNTLVRLDDRPNSNNSITFYSRVSPQRNELNLGNFTFKRLNTKTLSYNPKDWEDVIYCHSDNNCKINVSLQKDEKIIENWEVDSKTRYFYKNEISSYRLYLFDRGNELVLQQFNIINSSLSEEDEEKFNKNELIFKVKYEDQVLFNRFFDINFTNSKSSEKFITTIKIIPKILDKSGYTEFSWFPKLASGGIYKPISVTITDSGEKYKEEFYCIIKPNFSNTLKIYDANELIEIQSCEFGKNGGKKALYIASTVGITEEFDYWTIVSKDPEISVNYNNFGYNPTGAQRLITNPENISTWPNVPEAKTFLNTYSISPSILEYKYDDLVIRRATAGYSDLISYYRDWKNQLCEDNELSLSLTQQGQDYSDSVSIYIAGEDEELVPLEKGKALELGHIGLYKIYVKTSSAFRIIIDGPNKKDNFYFFDSSTNNYLPDILMKDISSFDVITGREVCFAFLGNEENSFKVKEQTLSTNIRVINLEDETEVLIPLHRKYFGNDSLTDPVLDTNIRLNSGDIDGKIFFSQFDYTHNLIYTSYLETISYIKYKSNQESSYLDTTLNLNYGAYSSNVTYTRGGVTNTIKSRGNINSSVNLNFSNVQISADKRYPVPLVGVFSLENPGNFNGERKRLDIYGLIPKPQAKWYTEGSQLESSSLKLYYTANSSTVIGVIKPGGGAKYILYYQEPDSGEWTIFEGEEGEVITSESGLFKIEKKISEIENIDLYEVTEGSGEDYEGEGDNILGSIKIESYVDRNNFLQDPSGNPIDFSDSDIFTQDYVNSLIPASLDPSPVTLGIKQKDKENSISNLTGDTSVISYLGETRKYLLHLLTDDEADIEDSLDKQKGFINSITFDKAIGELEVEFKSRLKRHNYSPITLGYNYDSTLKKYILRDNILKDIVDNYSGGKEDASFYIKTKTDTLSLSQVQEAWPSGIRMNGKLYMGLDNVVDMNVGYNSGSVHLYVAPVTLPTTSVKEDINSEFTIQGMPIIDSQSDYVISDRPETIQNYTTFGYTVRIINLPTNNSTSYDGPYSVIISDGSGINKIIVNINIEPKNSFVVELYDTLIEIDDIYGSYKYVPNGSRVDSLIFSASGKLRNPEDGLYLLTDAPDEYCNFYISSSNLKMNANDVSMSSISYQMEERILSGEKKGMCRREGDTEDRFKVWHIKPFSKVSKFRSYGSASINYLDYFGHKPYMGQTTIGINYGYGNSVSLPSYYGVCTLSIEGPYRTHLSTQYYESTKPEDSLNYPPLSSPIIEKWVEFESMDDSEINKYTRTNSHFSANSRLYSISTYDYSYYHLDNTIWINYTEADDSKPDSHKYKGLFDKYGYYCGFKFNIERYEWEKVKDDSTVIVSLIEPIRISNYSVHKFSDKAGRLKLIDLDLSNVEQREIYTDQPVDPDVILMERPSNNPYTVDLLKYYSNYEKFPTNDDTPGLGSSDGNGNIKYSYNIIEDKYSYAPGILLDLRKEEFTKTNDIYTISGNSSDKIAIIVSDEKRTSGEGDNFLSVGTNTDDVTFYINISLYNMDYK